jgi:hypothetical protein
MKIRWPLLAMALLVVGSAPSLTACAETSEPRTYSVPYHYPFNDYGYNRHIHGRPGTHRHANR